MKQELHISIQFEDGQIWATVEEFPGVFAAGMTLEELRQSLEEGIALYVAEPGKPAPTLSLAALDPPQSVATSAALVYA